MDFTDSTLVDVVVDVLIIPLLYLYSCRILAKFKVNHYIMFAIMVL